LSTRKITNILLRSPYKLRPVDGLAAKVLGATDPTSVLSLKLRLKDIQKAIRKCDDAEIKKSLLTERDKLLRTIENGPVPRTDSKAIERARRQLEKAKWMRDNGHK
jgi:hypothetical protein